MSDSRGEAATLNEAPFARETSVWVVLWWFLVVVLGVLWWAVAYANRPKSDWPTAAYTDSPADAPFAYRNGESFISSGAICDWSTGLFCSVALCLVALYGARQCSVLEKRIAVTMSLIALTAVAFHLYTWIDRGVGIAYFPNVSWIDNPWAVRAFVDRTFLPVATITLGLFAMFCAILAGHRIRVMRVTLTDLLCLVLAVSVFLGVLRAVWK